MNKKLILLASFLLCCGMADESWSEDVINCKTGQQSCGESCCWSVENKKLIITGGADGTVGTMDDYNWGKTGQNTQWPANVTSIYVSGVKNIGGQAFRNMKKFTDLVVGDSVKTVGYGALDNTHVKYVDFGDSVTSVGLSVLQDAPNLIQIIVPDTLTDINYESLGNNIVSRNIQIICRGDKVSCSGIYDKLSQYSSVVNSVSHQTYDATSQLSYADYTTCASTNYYWDGAKCVREPDTTKRNCCSSCKDVGGWCNRVRYTPVEAAEATSDDNTNVVTITFKN